MLRGYCVIDVAEIFNVNGIHHWEIRCFTRGKGFLQSLQHLDCQIQIIEGCSVIVADLLVTERSTKRLIPA